MSAWVIALGLGAGYLINKNLQMEGRLQESVKAFNSAARPASPGPRSEEIRNVQRRVPDSERLQDINVQDLPREQVQRLASYREAARGDVEAWESGPEPIQGVFLVYDNHGV